MNQTIKTRIEQIGRGEVPEGYKKTKAGLATRSWVDIKIGDYIEEYLEKTIIKNQYPILTSARKGIMLQSDYYSNNQVTTEDNIGYNIIPRGYITYRSRSDDGKFRFNENNIVDKGMISYFYPVFSFKSNCNKNFMLELLNFTIYRQAYSFVEGTAQQVLSFKKLQSLRYTIPPLEEQERIAGILGTQDKLIELKEKRIAEKKQQKTLISNQLFSDAYIKEKSVYGKKVKLGEICAVVTDYVSNGSFKNLKDNVQYLEEGYAVLIRLADFNNNFDPEKFIYVSEKAYKFLSRSSVYPGDIIISNVGSVGSIFRAPDLKQPMSLAPNTILVRTKICDDYFYQFVASAKGQELLKTITSTTAQPKFNKTDFKGLEMYIPDLKTQKYIAQILNYADEEIKLLRKDLEEEKQKKKALMQLLLTGIVRVV